MKTIRGRVLPSMPKGEIVGNVVIDGKRIGKEHLNSNKSKREARSSIRQEAEIATKR